MSNKNHKKTGSKKAPKSLLVAVRPRSNPADAFEQNPIVSEEAQEVEVAGTTKNAARVMEAVRRVVEDGEVLSEVAKEMGLAPASVYRWQKQYFSFLQAEAPTTTASPFTELSAGVAREDRALTGAERLRFTENWGRLIEVIHATEADFRQDPWIVFLQNSEFTSWLFSEDGRLERSTLVGFLVALLGIVSIFLFMMVDGNRVSAPEARVEVKATPVQRIATRDAENLQQAGKVVEAFLKCPSWRLKLQYLRDPERVAPMVEEFYKHQKEMVEESPVCELGMLGPSHVSVCVECPGLNRQHFFNVIAVSTKEGVKYLIDWESSTLYQEFHLKRFLTGRSPVPTRIHVKVEKGEYYNHQFANQEEYRCFLLFLPGVDMTFYGYAKLDAPVGVDLRIATMREASPGMILEARFPDVVKDGNMVEITRVIENSWLPE